MTDVLRSPNAVIDVILCDVIVDGGMIDWSIEIQIQVALFPVGGMVLCDISKKGP